MERWLARLTVSDAIFCFLKCFTQIAARLRAVPLHPGHVRTALLCKFRLGTSVITLFFPLLLGSLAMEAEGNGRCIMVEVDLQLPGGDGIGDGHMFALEGNSEGLLLFVPVQLKAFVVVLSDHYFLQISNI
ncbi:TPA: hypothetical protein NHR53_006117 [Pseudomonas aeruginosa]|uniref:hypothetical protein n=1 Tax=Pseudomonas aeruginosa TaxID=287 RepID=UPI000802DDDF|nr:hypothetical protein [Pseudomonas aeruginosa]OBY18940.1 hypothetical protein A8O37_30780 [Pseudomonas aeruginosa]HCE7248191.1 hypothetical protein [Pseudomonas aeruginosa]HCE8129521.1 hypothetical protein [Pseudomonas aeruginosa]HCF0447633.1 hypothetical protein [Pseudomonas aeruginosa]